MKGISLTLFMTSTILYLLCLYQNISYIYPYTLLASNNTNPTLLLASEPVILPEPHPLLDDPLHQCAFPRLLSHRKLSNQGSICVIVRTYNGHFKRSQYSIRLLMSCLEQMEYPYWNAYFFTTDENPIDQIQEHIKERPERFQSNYKYLDDAPLSPYTNYEFGYNSTDWAIDRCPVDAKWLLVTNGDNEYSPNTFSYLDGVTDGVGFDFFSRHYKNEKIHPTGFPVVETNIIPNANDSCKSFVRSCLRNRLDMLHNDLGAVIWNLQHWRKEHVNYSVYTPTCCHDGLMSQSLRENGWIIKTVPYCFLSHSPNDWSNCKHPGFEG